MTSTVAARPLHPILDFDPETGRAVVGVTTHQGKFHLVMRQGTEPAQLVDATALYKQGVLHPAPEPNRQLAGRWVDSDLRSFLKDQTGPSFAKFLTAIKATLLEHVEFTHADDADVVTTWIAGTYFYPLFTAFPRLNLQGAKGSGKSKVLLLIAAMAHNGLVQVIPTAPVLFRLIEPLRPTLCLDEMEHLAGDDFKAIKQVLNAGYKSGVAVHRVEGEKERRVVSFGVYTPVALAGIKGFDDVLADRTITVTMRQATAKARLNDEVRLDVRRQ